MANFQVSKEYVRGQLKSMGIQNISEEDLEAYTRDFSRLVEGNLDNDTSTTSESQSDISHGGIVTTGEPGHSQIHRLSASATQHTPANPTLVNLQQSAGSAVFKTFPGDKENRVHFLSPSPSPKLSPAAKTPSGGAGDGFPNSSLLSSTSVSCIGSVGHGAEKRIRRGVRRKVLRRCNGEVKVFDESISDYGSGMDSPSERIADLSGRLCDLSVTSREDNSLMNDNHIGGGGLGDHRHENASYRSHCCRSFIRPVLSHPHSRGLRKSDPVTRYHEFRQAWDAHKAPGEKNRNNLRWHIREQLTHQDVPYYEPRKNVRRPNDFVVPTDKKRSELRWEVRHTLAHQ